MKAHGMVVVSILALTASGLACTGGDASADNAPAAEAALAINARPRIEAIVKQTNIVADQEGKAEVTDPNLINAWGLAFNPAGAAWVSANGKGMAEVFDAKGATRLEVTIPPPKGGQPPSAPTGQVFNAASATSFKGDLFILVTEDGTVAGWQPKLGTTAAIRVDKSKKHAIYKGVAIATVDGKPRLYATDFHNGQVDVFDDDYKPVKDHKAFEDRKLPPGFAPFNVFAIGDHLLVSYALQDDIAKDDVKGPGNGFVDVFDADGGFDARLISRGALNSPWGMVLAPDDDDDHHQRGSHGSGSSESSVDLMVGNFGDGTINVYDLDLSEPHMHAVFEGTLADKTTRAPLVIDGLWALVFGPGGETGFDANDLFFTAGPNDEGNGLFGKLEFVKRHR